MSQLSIALLGAPRIVRDGVPIAIVRAKGVALLTYLAIMRSAQPRERLLDLLWPESMPQAARKNMRNTLWALGEALGHEALQQSGGALALAPSVSVDLYALEDALLLLESGGVDALEQAVARYHGPLADGLALHEAPEFELWLTTERERLEAVYLRLTERIIAVHAAAGAWDRVADYAQRALAADPLREPVALMLVEAHIRMGQRAQAAHQYALLAEALRRELDVAPLPETAARYQELLADTPGTARLIPAAPPPRTAAEVPFVGREAELDALSAARMQAERGAARVVAISGDLGMGKSRLWQTWADLRAADLRLLATHALEASDPVPFGPLLALLRQPGQLRALLHPSAPLAPIWLAELARLLPEISSHWPQLPAPLSLSPGEERARLLQALAQAIRALAQPVVALVIDDLHWADPSTLDWLAYLVDDMRVAPLLLVVTYRPQDASDRLLGLLAGWQRQGRLSAVALPPLSEAESAALLAAGGTATAPRRAADWVRQSGGNPYYLIELQRAMADGPPPDLAELLRARIRATVPGSALQALQAAAVLGEGAEFATIRATSGRSDEETLDALDALVAAAVLVIRAGGYDFVHPLVAAVIRQDLAPARRAFLHRRAAQALERAYAPQPERVAGQLTEHLSAAGDLQQAARWAELASARALMLGAAIEAAAYARRALAWEVTPQRQLLLGRALAFTGAPGDAYPYLEAALEGFAQLSDLVGMSRASLALGMLAFANSQLDVARRWLARVPIEQVRALDPALSAEIHLLLAGVERLSQSYAAAAAQIEHAAQLARQHQLHELGALVAFERGNLLSDSGDRPGALESFEQALRIAQQNGSPMTLAMVQNNLAYHTHLRGDQSRAEDYLRSAMAIAEQYALSFLWQYLHSTAGEIALTQGRLDQAEQSLARALDAASSWGNQLHMANVRIDQALVALQRADRERARALLDQASGLLGDSVDPFVQNKLAHAHALVVLP